MSEAEEATVLKEYVRLRKLYLDRRRAALEVLEQMGEAQGVTTKKLMDDLGLERDEEYGCDPKAFPVLTNAPVAPRASFGKGRV
jgi:hypothetical protein